MEPEEIKIIRKSFGLNQTEFGEMLGVGIRSVQNWESGKRNMSESVKILLEKKIKEKELLTGEGEMLNDDTTPPKSDKVTPVPEDSYMMLEYADLETAAGKLGGGGEITSLPETKVRLVPREYDKGYYLVVRVHGHSMNDGTSRSILEDDELLIKQYFDDIEHLPIRSKLFVITTREGSVVKQITKVDGEKGIITCHSFNSLHKDYEVDVNKEGDFFQIFTVEKKVNSKIAF